MKIPDKKQDLASKQAPALQSGDRFAYQDGTNYTLQKLPDFDLWILIGSTVNAAGEVIYSHWMNPQPSPLEAFGNQFNRFTRLSAHRGLLPKRKS